MGYRLHIIFIENREKHTFITARLCSCPSSPSLFFVVFLKESDSRMHLQI